MGCMTGFVTFAGEAVRKPSWDVIWVDRCEVAVLEVVT